MEYNVCKTCGAKDGRAGLLINSECLNCHETRKYKKIVLYSGLNRTESETKKTMAILEQAT